MSAAMKIFEMTKEFPPEERFSMTDQMRRSSRSVAANIAEAWRKRLYPAAFVSKLNDAESEAAETQTWLEFAIRTGYISRAVGDSLLLEYEKICSQLTVMSGKTDDWVMRTGLSRSPGVSVSRRP